MSMRTEDRNHTVSAFDNDLRELAGLITQMGGFAEQQVADAVSALRDRDFETAAKVIERYSQVDGLEETIDQHVVRLLAKRQPMAVDLRMITMALKISNDLERASDYAVSIAKRAQRLAEQPPLPPMPQVALMSQHCLGMLKEVLDSYIERDEAKATAVCERDHEVDTLYNSLFRELVTFMLEDPRTISRCIDYLFIAKNLERIGDHATNVAEKVLYMIHGFEINRPRHDDAS